MNRFLFLMLALPLLMGFRLDDVSRVPSAPNRQPVSVYTKYSWHPSSYIIDDSDGGFRVRGDGWAEVVGPGYKWGFFQHDGGRSERMVEALWSKRGVPVGTYDLYATWLPNRLLSQQVRYDVFSGSVYAGGGTLDQRYLPTERYSGKYWGKIGRVVIESSDAIRIRIRMSAAETFRADALMLRESSRQF